MFVCVALVVLDYNDNDNLRLSQFLHLPFNSYLVNKINNCTYEMIIKIETTVSLKEMIIKELTKNVFTNKDEIDCLIIGEFHFDTDICNGYLNKHYYDAVYGGFIFEEYNWENTNYIPILNTSFKKYEDIPADIPEDIHYIGDIRTYKDYIKLLNYIKSTDFFISDPSQFAVSVADLFNRQGVPEKHNDSNVFFKRPIIEKNKICSSKKKNRKVFIFE